MELTKDMIGDIVINIVNIIILFIVARFLLYKPVSKFLNERRQRVSADLAEAEKAKEEALGKQEEYNSVVAGAEAEREKMLEKAERDANLRADEIKADARREADEIVSNARYEAGKLAETAVKNARGEISDAAVAIAEKILARECTDADDRRIIDNYFEQRGSHE